MRPANGERFDLPIVCTYAPFSGADTRTHKPKIVLLDERNAIKEIRKL